MILESASTDILICSKAPLPPWMQVRPTAVLLGVDKIEGSEELAKKASCDMYITKDIELPPMLLLHSEFDPVVSVENSRVLYEKLVKNRHEAVYGEKTLLQLSRTLTKEFGKGFSRSNLQNMRLLYLRYPICQSLTGKLTWTHYCELLSISDEAKRSFYEKECINAGWSVRGKMF